MTAILELMLNLYASSLTQVRSQEKDARSQEVDDLD